MKISKPRIAVGGQVSSSELVGYLYKLSDELEKMQTELKSHADSIKTKLENDIGRANALPAEVKAQVESLGADFASLDKRVKRMSSDIAELQIWKEEFTQYVADSFTDINARFDSIENNNGGTT